jgi:segregation and condensation protein B
MDQNLALHIEALVFMAQETITFKEIKECLVSRFQEKISQQDIEDSLLYLENKYAQSNSALELVKIAEGYKFMTKGAFYETIATYLKITSQKKLSKSALETLSIIAYKQPVVKSELEQIRGVNCDYAIQKLLEKELVEIIGRSEGPGRPLLYSTSTRFMDYFGLSSLDELPKTKDFKLPDNTIGEGIPLEIEVIDLEKQEEE